jgi:hypothetical protein
MYLTHVLAYGEKVSHRETKKGKDNQGTAHKTNTEGNDGYGTLELQQ